MPKTSTAAAVKTPFLRYFLVFYGNFSYLLIPSNHSNYSQQSNKQKIKSFKFQSFSHFLRFLYHLALFGYFNWVCEQPYQEREQYLAEVLSQIPLVRLSSHIFDATYRLFYTLSTLYCLFFGPSIICLLDRFYLFHRTAPQLIKEKRVAKWIVISLILYDHLIIYLLLGETLHQLNYSKPNFWLDFHGLSLQYIAQMQFALFFRLLLWEKWALLESLKQNTPVLDRKQKQLMQLFRLNEKINSTVSVLLFSELFQYCLRVLWALCFTQDQLSLKSLLAYSLQLLYFPLFGWFSGRCRQMLREKSSEIVEQQKLINFENRHQQNKSRTISQIIYWHQVDDMYGQSLGAGIFSLITIETIFALKIILLITNYALLINQTV